MSNIYPDTTAGAIQCLLDMTIYTKKQVVKAIPDPYVAGVWKIILDIPIEYEAAAIVYLAGYKDPFGVVRKANDYESNC